MIYGCSKHYWVLVCRGSLADQSCDLIAEQNTVLMSTLLPGICLFYFTLVSGMWTTHNGEWPTVHQMLWKDNARSKLKNSGWANLPLNHMVVHCIGSNYKAEYRCPAFVFWGARSMLEQKSMMERKTMRVHLHVSIASATIQQQGSPTKQGKIWRDVWLFCHQDSRSIMRSLSSQASGHHGS